MVKSVEAPEGELLALSEQLTGMPMLHQMTSASGYWQSCVSRPVVFPDSEMPEPPQR
jgi:hypothetical protein